VVRPEAQHGAEPAAARKACGNDINLKHSDKFFTNRCGENRLKPALIDFQNIRVMRGEKFALDDFSLRIMPQEHIAILGPNGCGKSTLIKTITRECYPVPRDNSRLTILGNERWNVFELRLLLGIVSNDLMERVKGGATGREVVLSGFFSSTQVFANHHVEPEHLRKTEAVLERRKRCIWPIVRSRRCLPVKRSGF
jgi:ABC-type molybdenum transport system ATPase subunit/photorepair protein PhrA